MAIPTPISWEAPFDPSELKEYTHSFAAEMAATQDVILSSLFILPADAIAAGLEIVSEELTVFGGRVFFQVALASQTNPNWESGMRYRIRHQITTVAGRTLERSIYLTVKQL